MLKFSFADISLIACMARATLYETRWDRSSVKKVYLNHNFFTFATNLGVFLLDLIAEN